MGDLKWESKQDEITLLNLQMERANAVLRFQNLSEQKEDTVPMITI